MGNQTKKGKENYLMSQLVEKELDALRRLKDAEMDMKVAKELIRRHENALAEQIQKELTEFRGIGKRVQVEFHIVGTKPVINIHNYSFALKYDHYGEELTVMQGTGDATNVDLTLLNGIRDYLEAVCKVEGFTRLSDKI